MKHAKTAILAAPLCAFLCACTPSTPTGQVAATVDGVEITRNELASEPSITSLAPNSDVDAALPKVLGNVITRKVAVAQAKALKLDQTPEFIAEQRRHSEEMLSQLLYERWSSEATAPTPAAISGFINQHPQMFAGHKLFLVDQLQTSATGLDMKALEPLNSLGEIAAYFDRTSHKYRSGQNQLDSVDMATPLYTQLVQRPQGSPLIVKEGDVLQIVSVHQIQDVPVPTANQSVLAVTALRHQAANARLAEVRKAAKITYAAGFDPKH